MGSSSQQRAGASTQQKEAAFVVDRSQRIIQWSEGATALLGVSEQGAIGRPCYEVIGGPDATANPGCGPNCPMHRELQSGHLGGSCQIALNTPGQKANYVGRLVALPDSSGGAVVFLETSEHPKGSDCPPVPQSAAQTLYDLAALGSLSVALRGKSPDTAIEQVLTWLRKVTGAEAAELFLVEPQGGDLLLTSFQGPYKNAFFQITRFRQGEGFPGLVAATGAPVVSDVLSQDGRYLREAVKEKGFHSYVCVPVFRGGNVEGSLNVAARGGELDTDRVQRLLAWASSLVGDVLERAFLQAGYATIGNSLGSDAKGDNDLEELGQRVLRCMMALGGATSGSLSVLNRNGGGQAIRVTEGTHAFLECRQAEIAGPYACPALAGGHGVALYGPRSQWHQSCRHTSTRDSLVQCVPLIADGDHVGMVQLAYTDNRPSPPTTHLAMLLGIASHASQALKQTRQETEERQERELKQSRVLRRLEEQASHSIEEHTAEEGQWERPFLDIRCLGPFKLYRQGSLITPDRVQRRGALTLLKVLLVRAGQPIPRDELVEILWPESDPKLTTNRLFVLVHTLRHLVEPAPRERQWVLIQGDGDSYRFNTEGPCRVDFLEFRRFTSLADRALADGDTEKCIACYETALDSYRGHFLEDEAYSEWCWEEREALRERFLDVVERLGHLYVLQGKLQPAIELYRRGLKSDPLREELHRGLIQTLWHSGRPAQALHQYQLCKEILEQELGIAPGPPIQELVTQIRRA